MEGVNDSEARKKTSKSIEEHINNCTNNNNNNVNIVLNLSSF